jgi:Protein of unknown function (DUF3768)
MTDQQDRAGRIAKLNDEFRRQAGLALSDTRSVPGRCLMTAGIMALGRQAQAEILARVRQFSRFEPGDDPYGEHDFGSLSTTGGEQVFWKIDYFADEAMEYGAEDPDDPTRCFRVLTVMLAAEY